MDSISDVLGPIIVMVLGGLLIVLARGLIRIYERTIMSNGNPKIEPIPGEQFQEFMTRVVAEALNTALRKLSDRERKRRQPEDLEDKEIEDELNGKST